MQAKMSLTRSSGGRVHTKVGEGVLAQRQGGPVSPPLISVTTKTSSKVIISFKVLKKSSYFKYTCVKIWTKNIMKVNTAWVHI